MYTVIENVKDYNEKRNDVIKAYGKELADKIESHIKSIDVEYDPYNEEGGCGYIILIPNKESVELLYNEEEFELDEYYEFCEKVEGTSFVQLCYIANDDCAIFVYLPEEICEFEVDE